MRKRGYAKLPASNTRRWTIRHKAALLAAIRRGELTLEQARTRYSLSVEDWTPGSGILASTAYTDCAPLDYRFIVGINGDRAPPLGRCVAYSRSDVLAAGSAGNARVRAS